MRPEQNKSLHFPPWREEKLSNSNSFLGLPEKRRDQLSCEGMIIPLAKTMIGLNSKSKLILKGKMSQGKPRQWIETKTPPHLFPLWGQPRNNGRQIGHWEGIKSSLIIQWPFVCHRSQGRPFSDIQNTLSPLCYWPGQDKEKPLAGVGGPLPVKPQDL